jgi:cytochrome P450
MTLPATHFELFAPEGRRDPHPMYHAVRSERPVWLDEELGDYLLTRYADCEAILRDPRWSSSPDHVEGELSGPDLRRAQLDVGARTLLFLDPPDHTRLRRLVSKAFTPRTVERLRDHVHEIADDLLRDVRPGETWDLMSTLAFPLPLTVICELMGVPIDHREQFEGWSSDATRLLDGDLDEATTQKAIFAAMNFINYFNFLFDERRAAPRDDLVSGLLAVHEEGDRLSEEELRSIVMLLFLAGHETTMNLIGNGMVAFMQHRDQWDRLCADPTLVAGAVVECLRFVGPVHLTGRIASTELELVPGKVVPKGTQVVTLLAAANRDPAHYPDPDRFDISRADNHHLTFSHGIHYCMGAALARLEGQVVFTELARRYPDVRLACEPDELERREHFVLRGWRHIPLVA